MCLYRRAIGADSTCSSEISTRFPRQINNAEHACHAPTFESEISAPRGSGFAFGNLDFGLILPIEMQMADCDRLID